MDVGQQKELTTPITNPKTGKVQSYDYSDLNEFFKKKLVELNSRLTGENEDDGFDEFSSAEEAEEKKKVGVADTIKSRISDTVDDLPF